MVIPVGPPGAQHILKVVKKVGADGAPSVARSDIFGGKVIPSCRCPAATRARAERCGALA